MGNYILPAGEYVQRQVMMNDLNLFALHQRHLSHEPIATIRTTGDRRLGGSRAVLKARLDNSSERQRRLRTMTDDDWKVVEGKRDQLVPPAPEDLHLQLIRRQGLFALHPPGDV